VISGFLEPGAALGRCADLPHRQLTGFDHPAGIIRFFRLGDTRNAHVAFLVDEFEIAEQFPGAHFIKILIQSIDPGKGFFKMENAHGRVQMRPDAEGVDRTVDTE